MKSFLEMWKIIETDELGTNKPIPLSKVTPRLAQTAITSGKKDNNDTDDKAQGANLEDSVAVGSLLPMQKEVIPAKALGMAIGYLLGRGPNLDDMEAIVSNDNYIMDGHHRWAAATLIDPNRMVKVARVGLPASQLVSALNIWTKAKGRTGNPGKGDIAQFSPTIQILIDKVLSEGVPDQTDKEGKVIKGFTVDEVKQALSKIPGANGDPNAGANLMKENATKLPTQKHPDAPERVDMPVVNNKSEIKDVVGRLIAGDIDWNAPLSRDTQVAKSTTNVNVGANTEQNPTTSGQATVRQTATQQNVGTNTAVQGTGQMNVAANVAAPGTGQINVGTNFNNPQTKKFPQQQPNQQRQVASTQHEGPSLNEWLILAGVKKNEF